MGRLETVARARGFDRAVERARTEGEEMLALMSRLFPICRSLTGAGIRETFDILGEIVPFTRERVPSGERIFDWTVPDEWNIRDAYVANSAGERVIDFRKSNLHVVNYSVPVRKTLSLAELKPHLYSLPEVPEAVPYVASYYNRTWGFCLSHDQLQSLREGTYEVVIDSTLEPGALEYAEARLPGCSNREILLSTYCCHPSLANNELSGPVLSAFLYRHLAAMDSLAYGYRFLFLPETIGSITYLSRNGEALKETLHAGYVVSCVGDDGPYNYRKSRRGESAADLAAEHMLRHADTGGREVIVRRFAPDSGGDERQFNSPGFNLPVGSLLRSYPGEYREYHTSLDNLDFVSAKGMSESLVAYLRMIQTLEMSQRFRNTKPYGEPQLGRRGLYPPIGVHPKFEDELRYMLYLLSYGDGDHDLLSISEMLDRPIWALTDALKKLLAADLLEAVD